MLRHLLAFECRQILRNGVFWVVALFWGINAFAISTSEGVSLVGAVGNVLRNAPYVVIYSLGVMSVFSLFLVTIFVAGTALRDFELRTAELFFATPMKKRDYLLGRFGGGLLAAIGVMLVAALGLWLGSMMPWLDAARLGPTRIDAYLWGLFVIVLPNLFFISALLFAIAMLTRSMLFTYLGVIAFFVLWTVAGELTSELDARWIGSLIDPFGLSALTDATRYWSAEQRNTQLPEIGGMLLANRLLWSGIGLALLGLAFSLFRTDREGIVLRRRRRKLADAPLIPSSTGAVVIPAVRLQTSRSAQFRQFLHQARFDAFGVLTGVPFLIVIALGIFNLGGALFYSDLNYGTRLYPVTHLMLSTLADSYNLLLAIIVFYYAGELVWRERTLRVSETTDAYSTPDWVPLAAKLVALIGVIFVFFAVGALVCIIYQLALGYTNLELALYAQMLALHSPPFVLMAVLAVFLQVISGNKFLGYLFVILYILARVALQALDFDHLLYQYGTAPMVRWSDMNGFGHFLAPNLWFRAYWAALAVVMFVLATAFWPRGTTVAWRDRLRQARARLRMPQRVLIGTGLLAFAALGVWIFHNTNRLNEYVPGDLAIEREADYEKAYRQYKDLAQPRITDVYADVEIQPEQRRVVVKGRYAIENRHAVPIQTLHIALDNGITLKSLDFGGGTITADDRVHGYTIHQLATPMAPGEKRTMTFTIDIEPKGFTLDGEPVQFVANGTFFNNQVFPSFGYDARRELSDRNDRRKHDLGEPRRMAKIDDERARANTYIGDDADWVTFETIVSTSADQIALAPGYLQREWSENGRRYFHYKADTRLLNFFAWLSARWEVRRDVWNDVAIEVYHDAKHPYNVERMIEATKKSLDYYTRAFTPYQFRQLRILEFPRYADFAQAFANTVPYSESIGFIADLRDPDDIDYVFFVTAHEVAHQWWAHQVIGANVQGATMLSESLAEYSAFMVMEKEYGAHKMRKFLKYDLDRYLAGRSGERVEEMPVALNENQPYIHYQKGGHVFYALRDAIGEDKLNAVLARFLREKGFNDAPYPTSRQLLDMLREETDATFHPLIADLFEKIVFFDHRAIEATVRKREDGKYAVTLKVHAGKVIADGKGAETEAPIDIDVDIGVFARASGASEEDESVLYLAKHRITQAETTIELVVDGEPYDAGIDPYNKLIDRVSDDNRKRVSVQ
ncbi:MAG: M1 family aminopeptidase [Dokdonella sp.]